MELNADACIIVEFSETKRLVRLEAGEAIFQVASNPRRPFVVETGPIAIKALGTQFDVYRKKLSTRVAVIEGAVQVSALDSKSRPNIKPLTDLQQLDVPDDTAQQRQRKSITPNDVRRITAWTHGDIELEGLTLKEVFEEFKRYQHIDVDFRDPSIEARRFGGSLHIGDMDSFLGLLKLNCIDSTYDRAAQRITLTPRPGKRAGTACH